MKITDKIKAIHVKLEKLKTTPSVKAYHEYKALLVKLWELEDKVKG